MFRSGGNVIGVQFILMLEQFHRNGFYEISRPGLISFEATDPSHIWSVPNQGYRSLVVGRPQGHYSFWFRSYSDRVV